MPSLTFEDIIKRKIGVARVKGEKIPATLETALIKKGLGLEGMFSMRLSQETEDDQNIPDKALAAASERIDGLIEGILDREIEGGSRSIKFRGRTEIVGTSRGITTKDGRIISTRNLGNLLNAALFEAVRENMRLPRLVFRTGRFAHSANIMRVEARDRLETQRKNRVSIFYSYMLFPYQVFEKNKNRDPRPLIELSIKQTLKDLLSPRSFAANIFTVKGGFQ